jgi:hypothetical protein
VEAIHPARRPSPRGFDDEVALRGLKLYAEDLRYPGLFIFLAPGQDHYPDQCKNRCGQASHPVNYLLAAQMLTGLLQIIGDDPTAQIVIKAVMGPHEFLAGRG